MNLPKRTYLLVGTVVVSGIIVIIAWKNSASPVPVGEGIALESPSPKNPAEIASSRAKAIPVRHSLDPETLRQVNARIHEIASEAERAKGILDAAAANDPQGTKALMGRIEPFANGIVTAQLLEDKLFGKIIEETLEDPKVFELVRTFLQQAAEGLKLGIDYKSAATPSDLVAMVRASEDFYQAKYQARLQELKPDSVLSDAMETVAVWRQLQFLVRFYMDSQGYHYFGPQHLYYKPKPKKK